MSVEFLVLVWVVSLVFHLTVLTVICCKNGVKGWILPTVVLVLLSVFLGVVVKSSKLSFKYEPVEIFF